MSKRLGPSAARTRDSITSPLAAKLTMDVQNAAALFTKPGHERMEELVAKRTSYEALSETLSTLPRTLRRPGLIPLGPRLYAPGALVRTNEVTVLLGRAGDASYFAERSAFQAGEIVARRIGVLDEKIRAVEVARSDLIRAGGGEEVEEGEDGRATVEVSVPEPKEVKTAPIRRKKSVTFNEPVETGPVKTVTSARPPRAPRTKMPEAAPSATTSVKETARDMLTELETSLRAAEEMSRESGIVNIVERYDDDAAGEPVHVELPKGFRPDESVSFGDDSEEFLDVTGPRSAAASALDAESGLNPPQTREEYWQTFIDAEREEERQAAEEAKKAKKAIEANKKEEKEFGKGFAKGFFGAPPRPKLQKAKREAPATSPVRDAKPLQAQQGGEKAGARGAARETFAGRAVTERVVERAARPKPRAQFSSRRRVNMALADGNDSDEDMSDDGGGSQDELPPSATISRFRQMRAQSRALQ